MTGDVGLRSTGTQEHSRREPPSGGQVILAVAGGEFTWGKARFRGVQHFRAPPVNELKKWNVRGVIGRESIWQEGFRTNHEYPSAGG